MKRVLVLLAAVVLLSACDTKSSGPPVAAPPSAQPPAAATPSASAQPAGSVAFQAAAPVQAVSFANGGNGFLGAVPSAPGKHPAIIVIQEWWGVTDWIKQDVARFASQGYVALAVDLYRGKATSDPGEAHELMRGLPEDRAMGDMKAGFDWLAARPDVDSQHIGIVGWCMGGGYALAFAVAEPRLKAAVVNYGRLVTDPAKVDGIHAALLGNFAGLDRGIDPKDVQTFADALKKDHKDADIKEYDGAKHAFMNPNSKDSYDAPAATDAWSRIDAFFARTLKSA